MVWGQRSGRERYEFHDLLPVTEGCVCVCVRERVSGYMCMPCSDLFYVFVQAVMKAEKEIESLIKKWKLWLLCECSEVQPYMRFDFFVKRMTKSVEVGHVDVEDGVSSNDHSDNQSDDSSLDLGIYTGELTELGGSTLNWQEGPQLIFRSVLLSCLEGDDAPPSGSHVVVRRYESAHIRFNSDDDEGGEDDDDEEENDDEDDDDDGGRYDKKCPRFYESEKQKYCVTYGGSGVVSSSESPTNGSDTALKRAKLSP